VPLFVRELLVGGWAGPLLIGPLLIGPWLTPLAGYVPASRTILPYMSLWLETPDCASADVPQANRHNIADVNLMGPRLDSGTHHSSECPETHPPKSSAQDR
jgi:hypothetical protein